MRTSQHSKRINLAACASCALPLALLFGLYCAARRAPEPLRHTIESTLREGALQFAIGDFDGDLQPDVAYARVAREGAPSTEYSIELRFSSGPRSALALIAPAGGIEIAPADVNGDKITDLVVTSRFDSDFVAVYVNDGSGHFRLADPGEFPGAGKRSRSRVAQPEQRCPEQLAFLAGGQQLSAEHSSRLCWRKLAASKFQARQTTHLPREPRSRLSTGRAPPVQFS